MELMRDAGIKRLVLYPGYKVYGNSSPYTSSQTLASLNRLKTKAQNCSVTIVVEPPAASTLTRKPPVCRA